MILLVGLGNPGNKYLNSRHNIGFQIIDHLHESYSFPKYKKKFDGLYSKKKIFQEEIVIFKPMNFMNLSGSSVKKVFSFYKIENNNLFVFQDDLDIEFGKIKIKTSGGDGGHNGIKDIIKHLGKQFVRFKFGIKNKFIEKKKLKTEKFVLDDFTKKELKLIDCKNQIFSRHIKYLLNKNFSLLCQNIQKETLDGI